MNLPCMLNVWHKEINPNYLMLNYMTSIKGWRVYQTFSCWMNRLNSEYFVNVFVSFIVYFFDYTRVVVRVQSVDAFNHHLQKYCLHSSFSMFEQIIFCTNFSLVMSAGSKESLNNSCYFFGITWRSNQIKLNRNNWRLSDLKAWFNY